MHQLRRGVPSKSEGRDKQHLESLRHDFIEAHAVRKAAQPHVLGNQSQMITGGVRLDFRGRRVDQVETAITNQGRRCQPQGHAIRRSFHGIFEAQRACVENAPAAPHTPRPAEIR